MGDSKHDGQIVPISAVPARVSSLEAPSHLTLLANPEQNILRRPIELNGTVRSRNTRSRRKTCAIDRRSDHRCACHSFRCGTCYSDTPGHFNVRTGGQQDYRRLARYSVGCCSCVFGPSLSAAFLPFKQCIQFCLVQSP